MDELDIVRTGKALNTLADICSTAPKGNINYVSTSPANHHGNYFEVVLNPSGIELETLVEEIDGKHPLCSFCHRPRISECIGHRIGIALPFLYIQPQFAKIFVKFLNAICLNVSVDRQSRVTISGCGFPGSSGKNEGSVSSRMGASAAVCKNCTAPRSGPSGTHKFALGRHGDLVFSISGNDYPVSLGRLMEYISSTVPAVQHPVRENVLSATKFYDMNIDIRVLVTDKLYLSPYQLRPNMKDKSNYETGIYNDIVRECSSAGIYPRITDSINTSGDKSARFAVIYEHIAKLMSSKVLKKENKTIFTSLAGKNGIIRQNVTGAFTFDIGRAVIIPSNGNIGEFILSRHHQPLCVSEVANTYTIERLRLLAENSMVSWILAVGTTETVKYKPNMKIHLGDTVWRYLLSGDPIVGNRQPTLHRLSQMGHSARFHMGPVFGLHRCETTPTGGDFDGDEMNTFPAPTFAAQMELRTHGHAINSVHGPGAPAMSVVFHELAVMYILSVRVDDLVKNPDNYLSTFTKTKDLEIRISSYKRRRSFLRSNGILKTTSATIDPESEPLIATFRDVCSLLFPEDFTYTSRGLKIIYGVLISGEFEKKNIGVSAGSIVHALSFYPPKRSALFLNDVSRICDVYSSSNLISFNPNHMIHPDHYYANISAMVNSTRQQLQEALQQKAGAKSEFEKAQLERKIALLSGAPIAQIMKSIGQTKEMCEAETEALREMGAPKELVDESIARGVKKRCDNVFEIMYKSGCRGSERTATQMSMTLGAQYTGSVRTDASKLPWINNPFAEKTADGKVKQTILGNGIIDSSFMNGLTPEEYAVHSDPVRFVVVTGKTEVAGTGYISKQMSSIYGLFYISQDMVVMTGKTVISRCIAGYLNPTILVIGERDGHGYSSFVDPSVLVNSINFKMLKSRF